MFVKNTVCVLAAAAALAVGTQAPTAGALGCQQDFNIPTPIAGNTCSANGKSATGRASDASGGAGTRYRYSIRFNVGNTCFAMLLDGNGQRTKSTNGQGCVVAQDATQDGNFGPERTCDVSPTFSAVKIRVVVS